VDKITRSIIATTLLFLLALLTACGSSSKSSNSTPAPGVTRTIFIAAEDVAWDFAPTGVNQIAGAPFANYTGALAAEEPTVPTMTRRIAFDNVSSAADPVNFTADPAAIQVGTKYRKTLYFEYTDSTFTTRKATAPEWRHLGSLGPIIRAEVGDTIKVVFKNKTETGRSFTVHPHGVFYDKPSEGAAYASGSPSDFTAGNSVAPGTTFTYTWEVPERAGPGPADGQSVMWMYHSHVNEPQDENTGLIGPMIVYKKGAMKPVGAVGIDREFVVLFKVYDENDSFHFNDNLLTTKLTQPDIEAVILGGGFNPEPHLKHSMNGYLYGNLPLETMTMKKGEMVRWYLMSMGTEVDLHTPHWHGNTLLTMGGMRTDVVDVLPAQMIMADMTPDNIGTWLFHCHVNDHIKAGMLARYKVDP
jgi:FtsP/CotA-like multicopper oxidase with cupredoxin domain